MKKNNLLFLLLIGLLFRIAISFHTYSGDVTNHMIWGEDAVKNGLSGLYERSFEKLYGHTSPNYPPLTILIFAFLFLVKNWVYQFAWFLNLYISFFPSKLILLLKDFDYYPYLLKLPAIFADLGIAYLTYLFMKRIVGRKKSNWPIISAALVLFNPAFFYNSAYWGQTDSIPLFFLLACFYLLIFSKKFILSTILFTLGLLSKQTIIIFLPLYLSVLIVISNSPIHVIPSGARNLAQRNRLWIFIKVILISSFVFWLFFFPFYKVGNLLLYPFFTYLNKILFTSGLPFTSNHAFNFWYLLTGSRTTLASSKFILNISYETWGYLIIGFLSFLILFRIFRHSGKRSASWRRPRPESLLDSGVAVAPQNDMLRNIIYAAFLIPLTSFLFLTKMHERPLILALPFLLLVAFNNKFLLISYLFVSLFNFLNLYHNWWSPPIPLLQPILSLSYIINLATLLLIGLFLTLFVGYFKGNFFRENIR